MSGLPELAQRLGHFALPLVQGAVVPVGTPLMRVARRLLHGPARERAQRLEELAVQLDGSPVGEELAVARREQLQLLVPGTAAPQLGDDPAALLLLIALHDRLFLLHPSAARLNEHQVELLRAFTLQRSAEARRELTALPEITPGSALPGQPQRWPLAWAEQQLLGRHSLLAGLFRLWRADSSAATLWGQREYRGMPAPVPRLPALLGRAPRALPERRQVRVLPELLGQPESAAAVRALLLASPLTALLPPVGSGLVPALAEQAAWLRVPMVARLVVSRYLALGETAAVAEVGGALGALVSQSPSPLASSDLMTLFCLLGHLHLCVALSAAPPPLEGAAGTLRDSYALYAAVAARWPQLAAPYDVLTDPRLNARLTSYLQRCRTVAGAAAVQASTELCEAALGAAGMALGPRPATRPSLGSGPDRAAFAHSGPFSRS